jgi:uncharacterized protein YjbJ (UPF0337 family)
MNWNIVEGNWKQFRGEVKVQWGKLTDDHLDVIAGKRIQLAGKIQEAYGDGAVADRPGGRCAMVPMRRPHPAVKS